jgi:hypothetical protein
MLRPSRRPTISEGAQTRRLLHYSAMKPRLLVIEGETALGDSRFSADEAPRRPEPSRWAPDRPGESPEQGCMRRHPSQGGSRYRSARAGSDTFTGDPAARLRERNGVVIWRFGLKIIVAPRRGTDPG